jgi:2-succinyl-6-hydroxy-2,4-cyclohexadiene-1-carboxylate synthase
MSRLSSGGIDWYYETAGICCERILVLVHGFAQSHYSWDYLLPFLAPHFQIVLVDLPGFGKTPLPENPDMTIEQMSSAFVEMLTKATSNQVYLCGYSMGGRVALHALLSAPEKFKAAILIGASPGILHEAEREQRKQADHELAQNIREQGIAWFAAYWSTLPIFESQIKLPIDRQNAILNERLTCNPAGLIFALENFGTGEQAYLMSQMRELDVPLLLLAGAQDHKFRESNKLIALITDAVVEEIPAAGHAAHIENPEAVAKAMLEFIE